MGSTVTLPPLKPKSTQPAVAKIVAMAQGQPGLSRYSSQANSPAITGPLPIVITVPTATPVPSLAFWTSAATINQGECATLSWDVQNIQAVWVYPAGQPYTHYPATGQGSVEVCPRQTTTYEMRVLLRDGTVQTQQITIQVNAVNALANSSWMAATLYGAAPVPDTSLMIFFYDDGRVSVNGGCNTFNGPYQVSGELIKIGPLSGTLLLCDEAVSAQESSYLNALQSAVSYELNAGQLILRDGSGQEVVRFNRIG